MDFRQAWTTVIAELTPQPWDYTTPDGTTLTVIPRGWHADPGEAEVLIRITVDKALAAQIDITTTDMPQLLAAIEAGDAWEFAPLMSDFIAVAPADGGGLVLTVTEVSYPDGARPVLTPATIALPEAQRLPLVSALRRATDVARGWED
jgi:hypothetical protein